LDSAVDAGLLFVALIRFTTYPTTAPLTNAVAAVNPTVIHNEDDELLVVLFDDVDMVIMQVF
jgi:hypothetical protein